MPQTSHLNIPFKSRTKEYQREWRKLTGKTYKYDKKDYWLSKRYGLTLDDYNNILLVQNNGCAICSTKEPGGKNKRFHVDHCHKTGAIRGLLCDKCNRGLGYFNDSIENLNSAIGYLNGKDKKD